MMRGLTLKNPELEVWVAYCGVAAMFGSRDFKDWIFNGGHMDDPHVKIQSFPFQPLVAPIEYIECYNC